jgi:hypothetical protein
MTLPLDPFRQRTEVEPRGPLRIPQPIDIVSLQTSVSTIYTANDNSEFQIESLIAANKTASDGWVSVYLVPSGDVAGTDNVVAFQWAVSAKSNVTLFSATSRALLQAGGTLQAVCDTNDAINIFGFGYDYQGAQE